MSRTHTDPPLELQGETAAIEDIKKKNPGPKTRRGKALRRGMILESKHHQLIAKSLLEIHYDPKIVDRICRHVRTVWNPGADIATQLACTYRVHPRRRMKSKDGAPKLDNSLVRLNRMLGWPLLAPKATRSAWWNGPALIFPVYRRKDSTSPARLQLRVIHAYEHNVLVDDWDPLGNPRFATWREWYGGQPAIVTLDEVRFRILDEEGKEELTTWEHGVVHPMTGEPMFPAVHLRFERPTDSEDYWIEDAHERTVDATLEVGTIGSILSWVRKAQNRNFMSIVGDLQATTSDSRVLDPEGGFAAHTGRGETASSIDVKVHSFNQPVDDFRAHMAMVIAPAIEQYGLSQASVTFDWGMDGLPVGAMEIEQQRLSDHRNGLVPYAVDAERMLQYLFAFAAHRAEVKIDNLPEPKRVWNELEVEFPPLLVSISDADRWVKLKEFELARGLTTDAKIYQELHPERTPEECEAAVNAHLDVQAKFNDKKAKRNNDPAAPMEDENQRNGRIGGQARPGDVTDDDSGNAPGGDE